MEPRFDVVSRAQAISRHYAEQLGVEVAPVNRHLFGQVVTTEAWVEARLLREVRLGEQYAFAEAFLKWASTQGSLAPAFDQRPDPKVIGPQVPGALARAGLKPPPTKAGGRTGRPPRPDAFYATWA